MPSQIIEGVFAINKPPAITSAQVIRNLQGYFNPSTLFAPSISATRSARSKEKFRRKDKRIQVKIGHGGTLDPMATGVLIIGVGNGTKQLQRFLGCTKTYEATILFGAATETYDIEGKVLKRAAYGHVTKEKVEQALERFRGKIMQRPPIYSALRVEGKRLYEYAREGKELPREIEARPVEVHELQILEWREGGTHGYKIPEEEAEKEAKELAEKVLHFSDNTTSDPSSFSPSTQNHTTTAPEEAPSTTTTVPGNKRKRSSPDPDDPTISTKKPAPNPEETPDPETLMSGALPPPASNPSTPPNPSTATTTTTTSPPTDPASKPPIENASSPFPQPPAVTLRLTSTSGFYVRSLAHDLGEAVGSLACMCKLVRTRQGGFELGRNVLEYGVLDEGEEVWGPEVGGLLGEWERGEGVGGEGKGEGKGEDNGEGNGEDNGEGKGEGKEEDGNV